MAERKKYVVRSTDGHVMARFESADIYPSLAPWVVNKVAHEGWQIFEIPTDPDGPAEIKVVTHGDVDWMSVAGELAAALGRCLSTHDGESRDSAQQAMDRFLLAKMEVGLSE